MRDKIEKLLYPYWRNLFLIYTAFIFELELIWEEKKHLWKGLFMGRRKKIVQQVVDVEVEVDEAEESVCEEIQACPLKDAAEKLQMAWNEACQDAQVQQKHKLKSAIENMVSLAKG